MFYKKLDVVQAIEAPSSSINNNDDKGKEKKGRRGRKKKETNNPPPPPLVGRGGDGDSGGGGKNINVAHVQVTIETTGGTSSGSTRTVDELFHSLLFDSFDSTVKLWDVEQGRLLHNLNGQEIKIGTLNKIILF
ncbi:hypothetical protein MTR67_038849 [Solanum verrucosum]|uniref:Uncharacterized protein n=1 Tax=Solanum verrucosum TaxID=315347 RepID=A0AAF0UHK4_SOLVR|nr:hypothetical protein MTR67_038849 [Solanum verrucosum]